MNDVRSITPVRDELLAQKDDLTAWAQRLPDDFWLEEADNDIAALRTVAAWTMNVKATYSQQARTDFLTKADYRLVALGHAGGHTIVTHEGSAPDAVRVIKIPDAARAFSVPCREPFQLFRELGLKLVRPGTAT